MSIGEQAQCQNPECNAWKYLYREMVTFPWGSTYCKGECADRARDFRSKMITKGGREIFARPRTNYAHRRV
jgi:ribosomal protein L34